MSLFEDARYRWRETYFVLFPRERRPSAQKIEHAIRQLGPRYELAQLDRDEQGQFDSLTLLSPHDHAAMDISYVEGDEVVEQVRSLREELKRQTLTADEMRKLDRLAKCDARFDVYHFEEVVAEEDEDELLDPGALLIVLDHLAQLCHGVAVDPQSGTLL